MKQNNDLVTNKHLEEKLVNLEKRLEIKIKESEEETRQYVLTSLEKTLMDMEKRLNQRITNVGDLITVNLGIKIEDHEKRIKKLEKTQTL